MGYKKYRYLLMGLIIGMISTITFSVFAETSSLISAYLKNNIKFEFNGERKELPDEYVVLNYNDRTYVPARFIAEELGAEVKWIDQSSTIEINFLKGLDEKNQEKEENNKAEDLQELNQEETKTYSSIPFSKDLYDKLVTITGISHDNGHWRVYVKIENKGDTPIQLLQKETKVVVDGINYSMEYMPIHLLDNKWYNDIKEYRKNNKEKNNIMEGFITLPELHKNPEKFDLKLYILKNDAKQEKQELEFNVKIQPQ